MHRDVLQLTLLLLSLAALRVGGGSASPPLPRRSSSRATTLLLLLLSSGAEPFSTLSPSSYPPPSPAASRMPMMSLRRRSCVPLLSLSLLLLLSLTASTLAQEAEQELRRPHPLLATKPPIRITQSSPRSSVTLPHSLFAPARSSSSSSIGSSESASGDASAPTDPSHPYNIIRRQIRSLFVDPIIPPNGQMLEKDPSTFVAEGALDRVASPNPSYTKDFTFDPAHEFLVLYLNRSTSELKMKITIGGTPTVGVPYDEYARDIDQTYQPRMDLRLSYQYLVVKPSVFEPICLKANGVSANPCQLSLEITVAGPLNPRLIVPFHLGVLKSPIIPWSKLMSGSMATGQMNTYGMEISQEELPVWIGMLPDQATSKQVQTTDHMSFLFNAANPLQWFFPDPTYRSHVFGDEVDFVIEEEYTKNGRELQRPSTVAAVGSGGDMWADPNFGASGTFAPSLYLFGVYCSEDSRPQEPGSLENKYDVLVLKQWKTPEQAQWNGSTYGIVGALTLLVLCLLSAAVVVLRRRCHAHSRDDEAFYLQNMGAGSVVLTRAQRAELPQVDAAGRPIRYDAHGRVLPDLGARKEQIEALPSRPFVTGMFPQEDAHCTICLGEYEAEEKVTDLPCGHVSCTSAASFFFFVIVILASTRRRKDAHACKQKEEMRLVGSSAHSFHLFLSPIFFLSLFFFSLPFFFLFFRISTRPALPSGSCSASTVLCASRTSRRPPM